MVFFIDFAGSGLVEEAFSVEEVAILDVEVDVAEANGDEGSDK